MGRPAKKVNSDNVQDIYLHIESKEKRAHSLDPEKYSEIYIKALERQKLTNDLYQALNKSYISLYKAEDKEKAIPVIQAYIDSLMSADDRLRMWKALNKKKDRKNYRRHSFQLALETSEYQFAEIKSRIEKVAGFTGGPSLTNTDLVIGVLSFVAELENESLAAKLKEKLIKCMEERKVDKYRTSDLFKTREEACREALLNLGLDEAQAHRFFWSVKLDAFGEKTIGELLNSKEDKGVPQYLSKLKKLKEPPVPDHSLGRETYRTETYKNYKSLSNWVVLPSEDSA